MNIRTKKGFTLMEMLIVVAIIAILVAIAIPVFSAQLEKAREAVDEANMRSALSMATVAAMTGSDGGTGTATAETNGTFIYFANVGTTNHELTISQSNPGTGYNEAKKNGTVGTMVIRVVVSSDFSPSGSWVAAA